MWIPVRALSIPFAKELYKLQRFVGALLVWGLWDPVQARCGAAVTQGEILHGGSQAAPPLATNSLAASQSRASFVSVQNHPHVPLADSFFALCSYPSTTSPSHISVFYTVTIGHLDKCFGIGGSVLSTLVSGPALVSLFWCTGGTEREYFMLCSALPSCGQWQSQFPTWRSESVYF